MREKEETKDEKFLCHFRGIVFTPWNEFEDEKKILHLY